MNAEHTERICCQCGAGFVEGAIWPFDDLCDRCYDAMPPDEDACSGTEVSELFVKRHII